MTIRVSQCQKITVSHSLPIFVHIINICFVFTSLQCPLVHLAISHGQDVKMANYRPSAA